MILYLKEVILMKSNFPTILKEERLKNNLTQQKIAELVTALFDNEIEVSRVSVNRYEKGTRVPDFDILCALSTVLDVDLDYLLGKSNFKYVEMPLSVLGSFNENLKSYITKDDKESNEMIFYILDMVSLAFSTHNKKELTLVRNLLDTSITAYLELSHNRNIQYVKDGKCDLSSSERDELKSLIVKDFSKSLDKIDHHFNSNDDK